MSNISFNIDAVKKCYEVRGEVVGLIDELRRIHKNIEEFVMMHGCF